MYIKEVGWWGRYSWWWIFLFVFYTFSYEYELCSLSCQPVFVIASLKLYFCFAGLERRTRELKNTTATSLRMSIEGSAHIHFSGFNNVLKLGRWYVFTCIPYNRCIVMVELKIIETENNVQASPSPSPRTSHDQRHNPCSPIWEMYSGCTHLYIFMIHSTTLFTV